MSEIILLNPGPTNTLSKVKKVQSSNTDVCHRTEDFKEVYQKLKRALLHRFTGDVTTDWDVAIIGGSGTAALESMIVSLLPEEGSILLAGKYGERAVSILERNNIFYNKIACKDVSMLIPDVTVENLYFVENETTTGEKFSVTKIKENFPNAQMFIDATSSFGASVYKKDLKNIAAISFCSNKCLQAPAGLGIIIYRKSLKIYKRSSFYLDISQYQDKIPFTIPPQLIYSLMESLKGNVDNEKLFSSRMERTIQDFKNMGIKCINKVPSNSVIGFVHPVKSYKDLENFLKNRGIVIYSGIPAVNNSFRISTMSVLYDDKYDYIIEAFNDSCIC